MINKTELRAEVPRLMNIDPYQLRYGKFRRLRNIWFVWRPSKCTKSMGPRAFGVSGALTIPNFLITRQIRKVQVMLELSTDSFLPFDGHSIIVMVPVVNKPVEAMHYRVV